MKVQKEMRMRLKVGLMMVTLLTLASAAQADMTIVVGDHQLLANTAGQTVQVFLVADAPDIAQGLTFNAQLGDGGPDAGGVDVTPLIQGDIVTGTLFESNHNPVTDTSTPPSVLQLGFATQSGNVNIPVGASLLGTLIFDTTGFGPGYTTTLALGNTLLGPTNLVGSETPLTIIDGNITIVPEPSSIVLSMFAVAGFGAVAIRRRRARNA